MYHSGGPYRASTLDGRYDSGAELDYPNDGGVEADGCKDINFPFTTLENNYGLKETALREEVIAMQKDLTSMIRHVSDLY